MTEKSESESKSLIKLKSDSMGKLATFLPDTPWTTSTLHVLHRREGAAYVDSAETPRNVVVVAAGDGTAVSPDRAFLFGKPSAAGLREFVSNAERPTEFICDEDMAQMIREFRPDVQQVETIVTWFDYLEVDVVSQPFDGMRRLRVADCHELERLLPAWAYRTYRQPKDLIMSGVVYGTFDGDDLVSAAFTVDHSVKFERVAAYTHPDHRRKGYGRAEMSRVVNSLGGRGRVPCTMVRTDDKASWGLALKIGFPQSALMWSYVMSGPTAA